MPKAKEKDWFLSQLNPETRKGVFIIFLLALAGISFLSLLGWAGTLGEFINNALSAFLGQVRYLFPLVILGLSYLLANPHQYKPKAINYLGLVLLMGSLSALFHLKGFLKGVGIDEAGGYLGLLLTTPLIRLMGVAASAVIVLALLVISVLIMFDMTLDYLISKFIFLKWLFSKIKTIGLFLFLKLKSRIKEKRAMANSDQELIEESEFRTKAIALDQEPESISLELDLATTGQTELPLARKEIKSQTKSFGSFYFPLDLLSIKEEKPIISNIEEKKNIIKKTLNNFGIEVEMGEASIGPAVTQYTLKPREGIKLSSITALHNDLALALACHPIRLEAPIPGRSLVGIEVPNTHLAIVTLKEILVSPDFKKRGSSLTIALGKDVAGRVWLADLNQMPHLLVAGATGSGKSVCLNSIILSLIYQNPPQNLKMILVDPKRVELPIYNDIPHLLTPVVTDVKKTVNALKWTLLEMDRRYELLSQFNKRNIEIYNQQIAESLPYLVIIIDELADLMATVPSEVETAIIRLAQMSRAVGIHLVVATQRPSVDIITGLIKANITSRLAFSVASQTDSRTILDSAGAEKLLGRGDMLYIAPQLSKPKRLQGAMISDTEIKRVVDFIKNKNQVEYLEEITEPLKGGFDPVLNMGFSFNNQGDDELLEKAKEVIFLANRASASLLQRRLKIGYARAARLLDLLEEQGLIGPADGAKPREVLIKKEGSDRMEI